VLRIKVVERWPGPSRLLLLLLVGVALVLLNVLADPWLTYTKPSYTSQGVNYGSKSYYVGRTVTVLVVAPAILVALSLREQRPRRAILEALALSVGLIMASSVWIFRANLGPLAITPSWKVVTPLGQLAVMSAELILLCILVRLLSLLIVRVFMREVVIQTGTLCWTCGYDLTGNVSGRCPECGAPCKQKAAAGRA